MSAVLQRFGRRLGALRRMDDDSRARVITDLAPVRINALTSVLSALGQHPVDPMDPCNAIEIHRERCARSSHKGPCRCVPLWLQPGARA